MRTEQPDARVHRKNTRWPEPEQSEQESVILGYDPNYRPNARNPCRLKTKRTAKVSWTNDGVESTDKLPGQEHSVTSVGSFPARKESSGHSPEMWGLHIPPTRCRINWGGGGIASAVRILTTRARARLSRPTLAVVVCRSEHISLIWSDRNGTLHLSSPHSEHGPQSNYRKKIAGELQLCHSTKYRVRIPRDCVRPSSQTRKV